MEAILFILAIIIIFLMISIRNSLTAKFDVIQKRLEEISTELTKARFSQPTAPTIPPVSKAKEEAIVAAAKPTAIPVKEVIPPVVKPIEPAIEKVTFAQPIIAPPTQPTLRVVEPAPVKPTKPGFFERNPDLEKFIGENLANKIGIGILVLGIGFFVKYAIDQDWINEIGRVFIGILCGGALLAVAHRMRKMFAAFSSVLVGGGIAVLYLTIAIAFHEYQLFSQTAAFIIMLVITAFTVLLSLGYNRMELAIFSILGGFASPFMVSTGEGNYVVLFSYILILDTGMLVLAYYKKWNLVTIICYVFTLILFGSWLGVKFDNTAPMVGGAFTFATLFYAVFFAMNLVNNLRLRTPFKAIEITLLLSNTFFYYAAGMVILNNPSGDHLKGLFTAALGVINFVLAFSLYKRSQVDRNLVFLLIGLVLTFISLAAPIQLEGNYITLFWAAEAVLLLWLSQKSSIRLMKIASVVVLVLMVISLLMDWEKLYMLGDIPMRIMLNKAYITGLFSLGAIAGVIYLLKNETQENKTYVQYFKIGLIVTGIVLLYTSQFLELRYQLYQNEIQFSTHHIIIGTYNMFFMLMLLVVSSRLAIPQNVKQAFGWWGVLAMISYLLYYHQEIIFARDGVLLYDEPHTGFLFHYLLVVLVVLAAAISLPKIRSFADLHKRTYNLYSWFYVFFFVFVASAELDHHVVMAGFSEQRSIDFLLTQNHKIGFPILWGVASFILIAVGLKRKLKHLRIISLTLFLVTLLKLFLVDIRGISEGGKIAAFISLGILLLVVSFMYQRLKTFLLADSEAPKPETEEIL